MFDKQSSESVTSVHVNEFEVPLGQCINIGPTIAHRLAAIGLHTLADLRAMGPVEAHLRVLRAFPDKSAPLCYYLYSLQGALDATHWDKLPKKVKQRLAQAVDEKR